MTTAPPPASARRFALVVFMLVAADGVATSRARAQFGDFKIAAASYEYYSYTDSKRSEVNPDGGDVAFHSFKANLTVPITLAEDRTSFIPGFRYTVLDIRDREGDRTTVDALHSLMLKAGLWHRFNEQWGVFVNLAGGIASDFAGDLASDDLVFSGHLIGMWTMFPEFTIGLGIGYDRRTGQLQPLPLVAIDWQPSPRFMIRGVAPEMLAVRWRAVSWLTLGAEGALEGERYHLDDAVFEDMEVEVAYSVIKVGLAATIHWTPWIHSRAYGGAAASRRFEVFVDDVSQGDLEVSTGPYAGIELAFGPSGWKSDNPAH